MRKAMPSFPLHPLHPRTDPKPPSPQAARFPRTHALALRMGRGETMWFPLKMFLHTFCAKKYGPVAARATCHIPAGAAVRLLNFDSISVLAFFHRLHLKTRPKTLLPIGQAFSAHPCPRPKDRDWGNHVVSPKSVFAYFLRQKVWAGRGSSDMLYPCRSDCAFTQL